MEVPDVTKVKRYSVNKLGVFDHLDPDEIEKITVKPSTELIPDEYEHEDNQKGLVLIFYSTQDEENMVRIKQAFLHQGYDIPDGNLYQITTKEFVLESLQKVAQEDHENKTCFILVFMGETGRDGRFLPDQELNSQNSIPIGDVWSLFTSDRCPSLRYKPKIFIFQACKQLEMVSYSFKGDLNEKLPPGAYDVPAEADMLLIFKKIEVPWTRNNFILQFSNNLFYDGHKDDLIGLVTHTTDGFQDEKRPIIISTMTRKFYINFNPERGHRHEIFKNQDLVAEKLRDLKEKIAILEEQNALETKT